MNSPEVTGSLYTYLRTLAHEMAGPLTTVLGYTQLLQSSAEPGSQEMREDLRELEFSAQILRNMVNQLGRLARYIPEEKDASFQELAEDLGQLAVATARRFDCVLHIKSEPAANDTLVHGNPWLLRVYLMTLLLELFREPEAHIQMRLCDGGLEIRLAGALDSSSIENSEKSDRWEEALDGLRTIGASLSEDENFLIVRMPVCMVG